MSPLKTWNSKLDFDATYSIGAEPEGHPNTREEVTLHYHRAVMMPIEQQRAVGLVQALGYTPQSRIVVIGAAFAWLNEALSELGVTDTWAVDTSRYVQTEKGNNEDVDISAAVQAVGLNPTVDDGMVIFNRLRGDGGPRARREIRAEDVSRPRDRNVLKAALGGQPFEFLTESVLESLNDTEAVALSGVLNFPLFAATRVAHLVVTARPGNQPPFNWKSGEEWAMLLPGDYIVEAGTWQVFHVARP